MDIPVALSHCPELRRLELCAIIPSGAERAIISSIISTNIRTIALVSITPRTPLGNRWWQPLDDVMCELVDKLCVLGYEHTLELEFHFDPSTDHEGFLPKFREKGRVKILDAPSGEVVVVPVRLFCVLRSGVMPDLVP